MTLLTGKKFTYRSGINTLETISIGAKKAIKVLEAEMSMRRQTGKFEYMHAAEAWLNGGDYEFILTSWI